MRPVLSFVTAAIAVAAAGKDLLPVDSSTPNAVRAANAGAGTGTGAAAKVTAQEPRVVEARSASSFLDSLAPRDDADDVRHNLTSILRNGVAAAGHGRREHALRYAILGEPRTVHDVLVQTGDGKLALVVWKDDLSREPVTVELATTVASATLYDPGLGTAPTTTLGNVSSVTLTLTDIPQVIAL